MEIDKLLPEAIAESVRYQLLDNSAVHDMVYDKLKDMVKNKISDWKLQKGVEKQMRDVNRIDEIIEALRECWKQYPDLRLGQLIYNQKSYL